jgi:hypothetical protein
VRDLLDKLLIYSPGYQATVWGFDHDQIADLDTVLQQPRRIAALPVFYDDPHDFAFIPGTKNLDLEQFDLILFVDIEFRRQQQILDWIATKNCSRYLICLGGLHENEILSERTIWRPTWSFNFLQWNQPRNDFPLDRPFLCEALLGARREHRDYVMASMQTSDLLDKCIVTYRDVFLGRTIQEPTAKLKNEFPGLEINWPYVSPNLDPAWEVIPTQINNTVSSIVPWDIWNRCYYSIIAETLGQGDCFLMAEKIGKCCFARRLFIHFGVANWLANLRAQGFETFGSVIDESYDSSPIDFVRYKGAFDQLVYLSQQNHQQILQKVKPVLDHNYHRLFELKHEIQQRMTDMICSHADVC